MTNNINGIERDIKINMESLATVNSFDYLRTIVID